ncbi:DUF2628 domain-containing protein [Candidatus Cetobacterium colombiensis]|uniref:DUF2628 domain-containing protein n=1 Tax=Candidatus Cetobacterium colombiensis TaxID=3073100 RepID=A0ABU4WA33_9FUSO|nr:DUF2628 domain-containing protein [Candidatus Cetobacterium colombiensis]MDX8335559.1 DUF2628 domain-containing protein [Candidatus Cetobacterium colombiensis]
MDEKLKYVQKHSGSLEDFVKKNSSYYLESWKSEKIKFNFAAFLFESLWFAYRKMYLGAGVLLILNLIINLITFLLLINTKFFMGGTILVLFIRIYIGFKANDLYFNKAKNTLNKKGFQMEDKECGTSYLGVAVIVFLAVVFQVLLDFYLGVTLYYQN